MEGSRSLFTRITLVVLFSLLVAIVLLVFGLFRGIEVDALSLGNVQIEQLSVKLDGKLTVDVERLHVRPGDAAPAPSTAKVDLGSVLSPAKVRNLLHGVHLLARAFERIEVNDFQVASLNGSFRYREHDSGHFKAHSAIADIDLDLRFEGDQLVVDIIQIQAADYGLQVRGQVHLEPENRQLRATFQATIADSLPVELELQADREQLSFSGRGLASVSSIAPIIKLIKLGPKITPWIVDYLEGEQFTLGEVSGTLPYSDPAQILQTLRAEAHVEGVAYTFDQALEPVHAQTADVVFDKGILHIYPHQTTFYGQDGGTSYVDLDFNDHRFVVMVYIRTKAQLTAGINSVLAHYHVPLPFEQVAGQIDTDLTLAIEVKPLAIHINGQFNGVDSEILMGKQRFQVAALDLSLKDTTELILTQLDVEMDTRVTMGVTGVVDFATHQGELEIGLEHFNWPLGDASLALREKPVQPALFRFQMNPEGLQLAAPETRWRLGGTSLRVAPFTTPLDFSTLSGKLHAVEVTVDAGVRARVSGRYSGRLPYADLQLAVDRLNMYGVALAQPEAALAVTVGKQVEVSSPDTLNLSVKGSPVVVQPSQLQYARGQLRFHNSGAQIASAVTSSLTGDWDTAAGLGQFELRRLAIMDKTGAPVFAADHGLKVGVSQRDGELNVSVPALALNFHQAAETGWALEFADFKPLYRQSTLLQRLDVDAGRLHVASAADSEAVQFEGKLQLPYPLLVRGNTPIPDYRITGEYRNKITQLTINDDFKVELAKTVRIDSSGLRFNVPALLNYVKQLSAVQPQVKQDLAVAKLAESVQLPSDSSALRVRMTATDTGLWLDDVHSVPADQLMVHYVGGKVTGDLQHKGGYATLAWADGALLLEGHGFDDTFLNSLASLAGFSGGRLEFGAKGTPEKLLAGLRIRNTVIHDFKTLNNILAFLNTVPALVTFSSPHYDSKGLPLDELTLKVDYQHKVLNLDSLHLDSGNLLLNGSGDIDLANSTVDMVFNVITGAKKSVERIPLLGFILAGGEQRPSITVKVEGDLHDPKVSQNAFKEVVTYPFAVIARTILLPVHVGKEASDKSKARKESAGAEPSSPQ